MKRAVVTLGIALLIASVYTFYHNVIAAPHANEASINFWTSVGLPTFLFVLGAVALVWATSDNFYRIKTGKVIAYKFSPAHHVEAIMVGINPPVVMPEYEELDHFSIQLRDKRGRIGWIHFDCDISGDYPINSQYP
ncbi:MAG TPA: hypothetical protein VLE69_03685 [Candidatus Saccharimonadales bacterium]|nr:hypothetical protein [Candidatus Saccharimonadales bacterium]